MRVKELRTQSRGELEKLLQKRRSGALNFRFRVLGGRVKNIRELRDTRKDIARILTILKEKS